MYWGMQFISVSPCKLSEYDIKVQSGSGSEDIHLSPDFDYSGNHLLLFLQLGFSALAFPLIYILLSQRTPC